MANKFSIKHAEGWSVVIEFIDTVPSVIKDELVEKLIEYSAKIFLKKEQADDKKTKLQQLNK